MNEESGRVLADVGAGGVLSIEAANSLEFLRAARSGLKLTCQPFSTLLAEASLVRGTLARQE